MVETLEAAVARFDADVPDWAVAEALNAPDASLPTKRVKVPVSVVRSLYLARGFWGAIVRIAADSTKPDALRDLCTLTRDTCTLLTEISTDDPVIYARAVASADALLGAGLIDQATRNDVVALADAVSSWADLNNGGVAVTARDVGLARGGVA